MESLAKELKNRLKTAKKIAVLGIGSEFRGDDAAGVFVAQAIEDRKKKRSAKIQLRSFIGSTAPENITGEVIRFKPTHLIMVDTADIGQKPGMILLLNSEDVGAGVSFSTHKLPAKILMDYFTKSLKCSIMLIGIQPKNMKFGQKVSAEVKKSVKDVSNAIIKAAENRQ